MNLQGLQLIYDRKPSFSALLQAQSHDWLTVVSKDSNRLFGFASMSVTPRYWNGELQNICYLGDLRAEYDRSTMKLWRRAYGDLLLMCQGYFRSRPPQKFLTAILKDNKIAQQSLVRQRPGKTFAYDYIKSIQMVNILGSFFPVSHHKGIRWARSNEEESLRSFIETCHRKMNMGYDYSSSEQSEWNYRKANWPDWSIDSFLVMEEEGEIQAVCFPWSPTALKRMRVENCSWGMRWLFKISGLFGCKNPKVGENFTTLYLTHLSFLKTELRNENWYGYEFSKFLLKSKALRKSNLISFCSQTPHKSPSALLVQKTDVDLFFVRSAEESKAVFVDDYIDFEMALV